MRANAAKFLGYLHKSTQFVIPIYQRTYSWTEKQCEQLWNDIVRVGSNDDVTVHFVGSIVYVEDGISLVTSHASLLVIDGQQRLTTVTLLLEALARAVGDDEPVDGFSAEKIRAYYLTNGLESGDRFFKLLLSENDSETLKSLIKGREATGETSIRINQNFDLFSEWIKKSPELVPVICKGLSKLMIVDIALDREHDNPQLIFESMNSTGKALSQADLIRNFILMGLKPDLQTDLYKGFWRPIEMEFGQEAYGTQFDAFMRYYLTVKTGEVPKVDEVYDAFKVYALDKMTSDAGVTTLVSDIRKSSKYYCAMALGAEPDVKLKAQFQDLIQDLKYSVTFPFLLELYEDYDRKILSLEDFSESLRLVESYVFRRSICDIPANSLNKTFAEFSRDLDKDHYLESIKARFKNLPSYRRFPDDEEFRRSFETKSLYKLYSRSYLFRKLENFGSKERVSIEEYSIEHVMPQNPNLSTEWQTELGPNWKSIQEKYLHTLGNLTLTGYNPEYSDRPFTEKLTMKNGFKDSPLRLNSFIKQASKWDESSIVSRAKILSEQGCKIWPMLDISPEVMNRYQTKVEKSHSSYTLDDHPQLLRGENEQLFSEFRKAMLALDPCVTEVFLKLYVAYKAETNFVDVIPKAKGMRLTLNLSPHELDDPKGISRDISDLGRWGNGDVSVNFNSIEELPYIIGLIRQSFEKQMGVGVSNA